MRSCVGQGDVLQECSGGPGPQGSRFPVISPLLLPSLCVHVTGSHAGLRSLEIRVRV